MSNGNCIKKYGNNTVSIAGQNPDPGIVPRTTNHLDRKINYCSAPLVIFTCVYLPNTAYLSEITTFSPHISLSLYLN